MREWFAVEFFERVFKVPQRLFLAGQFLADRYPPGCGSEGTVSLAGSAITAYNKAPDLERKRERKAFMAMKVEIRDNKLCIEIDLEEPKPSSSGKTLVVASTRGNVVTDVQVDGKPVTIGLNAYIKP
jgi:hypothetical protein